MIKKMIRPLHKEQGKDTKFQDEITQVYEFLQDKVLSATMVTEMTGIKQKNVTRYKRKLEKQGLLWVAYEDCCKYTKRIVQYITTNPDLVPEFPKQLKLEI